MDSQVDQDKLNQFLGKMVTDLGAAMNGALVIIGDKLGLYKALHAGGAMTSQALAEKTGTAERYIREWLSAQAAQGYVTYHPESETFSLSPEQAMVFADEESPVVMTGGFYVLSSAYNDEPRIANLFKSGEGIAWGDHCNCLFCGTEKFFRPTYKHHLVQEWLPAMNGTHEQLKKGIKVADIGCGHAVSTMVMARAFPDSDFVGIDLHEGSIEHARRRSQELGIPNVQFRVADASKPAEADAFDFITTFDCLHDMGDPAAVAAQIKHMLTPEGTWMIVEPFAHDTLEENLNPVGSVYYAASSMICVPSSLSQENGKGLGAQAGEARIRAEVEAGGFSQFERVSETPFNIVYAARP